MNAPDNGLAEAGSVDTFAEAEALVDRFGPRPPGSDAERRAAVHLAARLRELGRDAETEPFSVWPRWAAATALAAVAGVIGSVLSVYAAGPAAALLALVTVLTLLDLSGVVPTTRRLLGRRASQNVVSWGDRARPGALVLVAHVDSGPRGLLRPERLPAPVFFALVAVLVCAVLRLADLAGVVLTAVQFVPTVVLILAVPALLDLALSEARPGENDNASGVALALRLAGRARPERFGVHVLLTGSQKSGAQGMRAFHERHGRGLARDSTVVLNLDAVGSGEPRFMRREGPLLRLRAHPSLAGPANRIAPPATGHDASDAYAARSAGLAAITLSCDDPRERLDEHALDHAEAAALELIERLDELSAG